MMDVERLWRDWTGYVVELDDGLRLQLLEILIYRKHAHSRNTTAIPQDLTIPEYKLLLIQNQGINTRPKSKANVMF